MPKARRKTRSPNKRDLREGQWWDEVGSAVVNARSRKIITLGSINLQYEDELGRRKIIEIASFLRWARTFAECKEVK